MAGLPMPCHGNMGAFWVLDGSAGLSGWIKHLLPDIQWCRACGQWRCSLL